MYLYCTIALVCIQIAGYGTIGKQRNTLMSKKHRHETSAVVPVSDQAEYRIIRGDLVKVLVLNVVYLAVILVLYYANNRNGAVDRWFGHILHF